MALKGQTGLTQAVWYQNAGLRRLNPPAPLAIVLAGCQECFADAQRQRLGVFNWIGNLGDVREQFLAPSIGPRGMALVDAAFSLVALLFARAAVIASPSGSAAALHRPATVQRSR